MNWLPKLYKLSSTGKVYEWQIGYDVHLSGGIYAVRHGQVGGKIQQTSTVVSEGKNIDKANETTPLQQAELEANSLWNKQKDRKGYSLTVPQEKPFRPMLAQKFSEHSKKIQYPAFVQRKIDGIRCITYYDVIEEKVVYMSRQGKFFNTLEHLTPELRSVLRVGHVLDGELYNHALKNDFQKLVSLIRRDKPVKDSSLIQYHVYDMISEYDFDTRRRTLSSLLTNMKQVKTVETYEVSTPEEVKTYHDAFVQDGYEGAMVRNKIGPYEIDTRSYNLQKYKEFMDEEFKIVGAEENKGKQEGQCSLICVTQTGQTFAVKPKGSDYERCQIWEDFCDGTIVPGDMLTVRFFGYTNDGIPRFPIGLVIRNYED